ncbi:MAG: hypothetical protein LQ352_007337 [Teloschistes flavicans]|nr:MAG: hypothetical protein LQ352_007337 [Teloschistes flavicans]
MDNIKREPSSGANHDEEVAENIDPPTPSLSNFTDYAHNDHWWTRIFSSSQAEQGDNEDAIDYCNRIAGWADNLTNVDKDSLDFLVFQRTRAGLLDQIKHVLNAQLDQPLSLKNLGILASRIQKQLPPRTSTASTMRGSEQPSTRDHSEDSQITFVEERPAPQNPVTQQSVQQNTIAQIPTPQQGGQKLSAQRLALLHRTKTRSRKRKSLHDFEEAELKQALLKKRHVEDAKQKQKSFAIQGQTAKRMNPQAYPDSLITGQERQRCKDEGLCYNCLEPGHMHLQCPYEQRHPQ